MFHLGTFTTDTPVFLAPMAGFTDAAMRRICHGFGAALTYTEMVNAAGVLHASDKTWHLLETLPGEGPVVAHLYGHEPGVLGEAAARVAATGRFVAIDLNAGCPVRKIAARGAGIALTRHPEIVGRIVAAMHAASPLPITVKTRLGARPDKVTVFEVLRAVEEAGGAALTVHGRFASQEHTGPVRLDLLAEIKRASRIPVIGNGGVRNAADALQMRRETGVDAVMVARAAIGNPWLFAEIAAAFGSSSDTPVSHFRKCETDAVKAMNRGSVRPPRRDLDEIRALLVAHVDGALELRRQIAARYRLPVKALPPEEAAAAAFRGHLFRYLVGMQGASFMRRHLNEMRTLDKVRRAVDDCLAHEAAYRARAPAARAESLESD